MNKIDQSKNFSSHMRETCLEPYQQRLSKRKADLFFKRLFDIVLSSLCLILFLPGYLLFTVLIRLSSKGPAFFLQERVGKNGRLFYVIKFRTMVIETEAPSKSKLTLGDDDPRVTPVGNFLRVSNIDEFPQFFNVLKGDMSLIGARPEIPYYYKYYKPEDYAVLLMRPGMTSPSAIEFRHESEMLKGAQDPEAKYRDVILPAKMAVSRRYVWEFSFLNDLVILGKTFACIFQKDENLEKFK